MKRLLSLPLLVLLIALSCSKNITQAGGLELILMSDVPASEINKVHLVISQEIAPGEWHTVLDRDAFVHDPPEVSLPSTASIAAGHSPNQGALIVFTGMKESQEEGQRVVVQRVVQTQVPTDRIAELKILLAVPCVGRLTGCNVGESCQPQTGACGPNIVDSSTLPTYDTGGETPGTGGLGTGNGGSTGSGQAGAETPGTGGLGTGNGGSTGSGQAGAFSNTGFGGSNLGGSGGGAGRATGTGTGTGGSSIPQGPCVSAFTSAVVQADVLSDLEGSPSDVITSVTPPGGRWFSYKDTGPETTLQPEPGAWAVAPGYSGSAVVVKAYSFTGGPPVSGGVGFSLSGTIPGGPATGNGLVTRPTDVGAYTGISFYAMSALGSDMSVQFATPDTDPSYCFCANRCGEHAFVVTNVAPNWTKYTVKFTELRQPINVIPVPFDITRLLTIKFASNGPVMAFQFSIDDITLTR